MWALKAIKPKNQRKTKNQTVEYVYFCKPTCLMKYREPILEAERIKREQEDAAYWEIQDRIEYRKEMAEERKRAGKVNSGHISGI